MSQSFKGLTQILCSLFVFGSSLGQQCPQPSAITPCKCVIDDDHSSVTCGGDKYVDLKSVFATIGNNKSVLFDKFTLSNSAIMSLDDHVFGTVAFKSIEITDAYRLNRISRLAFSSSVETLEEFRQNGDSLMSDAFSGELFDALSSLLRVNRIFLDFTKITKLPDNAFRVINGRQSNLESIHMNFIGGKYGSLSAIGVRPFYPLDNLKYISIANQPIKYLKNSTFDFERSSSQTLEIHLEATQIRGDSFEHGVFQNSKRPLDIDLSNNQVQYLDESVFRPVFDKPKPNLVLINIQNNPLKCGCESKWLLKDKKYVMNLLEPDCTDGDSLFDKSLNDFPKCT